MYNVPLVFQLWENPQKKKSPMKRRCALGSAYINDYEKYTTEVFYLLNYIKINIIIHTKKEI